MGGHRITTGARYKHVKYKNAMLMFVPMANDSAQMLDRKAENRRTLLEVMMVIGTGRRLTYDQLENLASKTGLNLYGRERYERYGGEVPELTEEEQAQMEEEDAAFLRGGKIGRASCRERGEGAGGGGE